MVGLLCFLTLGLTFDELQFTGMLLMCSVHLDSLHTRSNALSPVSTALKLEAMRKVREKIQTQSADDIISCIAAIACLAACALVSEVDESGSLDGAYPLARATTTFFGYQVEVLALRVLLVWKRSLTLLCRGCFRSVMASKVPMSIRYIERHMPCLSRKHLSKEFSNGQGFVRMSCE